LKDWPPGTVYIPGSTQQTVNKTFNKHNEMRIRKANSFNLSGLIAGLGLMLAGHSPAQTVTTLYSFPAAVTAHGVIVSGNTLYGTTMGGGGSFGNVFAINTDGAGFGILYTFTDGSDGAYPEAGLVVSGNTLYGTASQGGSSGKGTIFAVNTNGTGFTTLYSFTGGSDGANLWGALVLSGGTLYGTASEGGSAGEGTVFAIDTDGASFTTLHGFTAPVNGINSDGFCPVPDWFFLAIPCMGLPLRAAVRARAPSSP
jgi:uncharacterized repeat protein (TIGR03803 family)